MSKSRYMSITPHIYIKMLDGETKEQCEDRLVERIDPDRSATIGWDEDEVEIVDENGRIWTTMTPDALTEHTISDAPRVMTLEEVQNAEDCCDPVFFEMDKYRSTPDVFSWMMVKHVPLNNEQIYVLENPDYSCALEPRWYGVYWRCWTARPTDEQRKAVKWDD